MAEEGAASRADVVQGARSAGWLLGTVPSVLFEKKGRGRTARRLSRSSRRTHRGVNVEQGSDGEHHQDLGRRARHPRAGLPAATITLRVGPARRHRRPRAVKSLDPDLPVCVCVCQDRLTFPIKIDLHILPRVASEPEPLSFGKCPLASYLRELHDGPREDRRHHDRGTIFRASLAPLARP